MSHPVSQSADKVIDHFTLFRQPEYKELFERKRAIEPGPGVIGIQRQGLSRQGFRRGGPPQSEQRRGVVHPK